MVLLTACVLADVSIDNRGCPCVEGWACRDGVCVADGASIRDGGVSDAGTARDGACDKQIEFDPENCGTCGRSCRGAACKDGRCTTTRVVAARSFPTALSVSPRAVTFTTYEEGPLLRGDVVEFCPRAGCTDLPQIHSGRVTPPISLVTSADDVFWGAGNGALARVLHEQSPDGSFGKQSVASDTATISDIALSGTNLYFAEQAASGAIRACDGRDLTTCADGRSTLFASNQVNLRSLVLDETGQHLVWVSDERGGSIVSCGAPGPCPEPMFVVSNLPGAHAVAADATRVYWTDPTIGSVMSAPAIGLGSSESPNVLAADLETPWAVALDGEYVYVTILGASAASDAAAADGTLVRIPRAGGTPLVLARNLDRPWAIAVDGDSVYWTNRGTVAGQGSIERVSK